MHQYRPLDDRAYHSYESFLSLVHTRDHAQSWLLNRQKVCNAEPLVHHQTYALRRDMSSALVLLSNESDNEWWLGRPHNQCLPLTIAYNHEKYSCDLIS